MRFSAQSSCHVEMISFRYGIVNGPRYAIIPLAINTSPKRLVYFGPSFFEISPQRTRSPPRPAISFSARSSLALQSSYRRSSSSFVFASCASSSSIPFNLSSTILSSARFASRAFIPSA